jgi:hypothetical protein
MRTLVLAVLVVTGCGRLGFDAGGSGGGPGPGPDVPDAAVVDRDLSPTTGLVAHWDFENLGAGGAMSAVGGDMASCTGGECPAAITGARGTGARFDGSTSCLHVPSLTSWSANEVTLSSWVYIASSMIGGDLPIIARNPDGCPSPGIQVTQAEVGFMFMGQDTTHFHAWTAGLASNSWHQLGIRWDGTKQAVFVDGQCLCDYAPGEPILFADSEFTIGCDPYGPTYAAATIDEIRIYDRALADSEMPLLYAVGARDAPSATACTSTCAITTAGPP